MGTFTLDTLAQMVRRRLLSADVPVAADGSAEWQPLSNLVAVPMLPVEPSLTAVTPGPTAGTEAAEEKPVARHLCEGLLKLLDRLTGLPALPRPPLRRMADELFRTHTEAEADALLSGRELSAALPVPAPWLFSRVLGYGLLAGALLMWALNTFANPKLIPGELFFFCVTVPVATLVFLIELCGLVHPPPTLPRGSKGGTGIADGGLFSRSSSRPSSACVTIIPAPL
ncbi:MAG: hypothetical protein Q7Q73_09455 [Verrucomicrobiota bacterium JB024]|nr:hypothetical protein [Verrucomicrobiota bacterium JB024]